MIIDGHEFSLALLRSFWMVAQCQCRAPKTRSRITRISSIPQSRPTKSASSTCSSILDTGRRSSMLSHDSLITFRHSPSLSVLTSLTRLLYLPTFFDLSYWMLSHDYFVLRLKLFRFLLMSLRFEYLLSIDILDYWHVASLVTILPATLRLAARSMSVGAMKFRPSWSTRASSLTQWYYNTSLCISIWNQIVTPRFWINLPVSILGALPRIALQSHERRGCFVVAWLACGRRSHWRSCSLTFTRFRSPDA